MNSKDVWDVETVPFPRTRMFPSVISSHLQEHLLDFCHICQYWTLRRKKSGLGNSGPNLRPRRYHVSFSLAHCIASRMLRPIEGDVVHGTDE